MITIVIIIKINNIEPEEKNVLKVAAGKKTRNEGGGNFYY